MVRFLCIFAVTFPISFLVYAFFRAVDSLERIADALEDFVYGDEKEKEESEVKNAQE